MAGPIEETVYINGYEWRKCNGTALSSERYELREVERLGGNPQVVRERATRYTGNEISRSNTA